VEKRAGSEEAEGEVLARRLAGWKREVRSLREEEGGGVR